LARRRPHGPNRFMGGRVTQHQYQVSAAVISMVGMLILMVGTFSSLADVGALCPLGISVFGAVLVFAGFGLNEAVSRRIRRSGHR
jgi:uncharacterized membrane protein